MNMRTIPRTDIKISPLCLGTMIFGEQLDETASHGVMDTAIKECGINFIDTAELYPVPMRKETYGRTDDIIGSWLANNSHLKSSVVIASKVIAYSSGLPWFRGGPRPTKDHFSRSLDASLKRLNVECIDLFQIHWPSRNTPMFGSLQYDPSKEKNELPEQGLNLYEQAEAMNSFIKAGKIRAWGLCNENTWGLMSFLRICKEHSFAYPATLQNAYNLLNRTFEPELHEACHREDVGLLVYSPLAFGHLTGKYLSNPPDHSRLSMYPSLKSRYNSTALCQAVSAYKDLSQTYSLEMVDMALAFVNQQPFVTSNIIGASRPDQVISNVNSLNINLPKPLLKDIEGIHKQYTNPTP